MPVYDYSCGTCGVFTAQRPMAEYLEAHDCPDCGVSAPRVMVRSPRLANMGSIRRTAFATNERAAHEPKQSPGHTHGTSCGCSGTQREAGAAKSFPARRPWTISH